MWLGQSRLRGLIEHILFLVPCNDRDGAAITPASIAAMANAPINAVSARPAKDAAGLFVDETGQHVLTVRELHRDDDAYAGRQRRRELACEQIRVGWCAL